jgi:enoyl-CoA hydratase
MLDVPKNNENNNEKSYADGKILQSVTDGVGVITFNNPAKRNAMSLDVGRARQRADRAARRR